jgi:hypothetical protein
MHPPFAVQPSAAIPPDAGDSRWRVLRPWLARGLWLTLVVATLTILLGSLPVYQAQLRVPCSLARCGYQQLTAEHLAALNGIGISLDGYVVICTALLFAGITISLSVSALIIWRRAGDGVAALVALMLVTAQSGTPASAVVVVGAGNPWWAPNGLLLFLNTVLLAFVLLLFPSGRFVPRWMRWFALGFVVVSTLPYFLPDVALIPGSGSSHLGWLVTICGFVIAALSQVYRYWRERSTVLRQQTKWVAFGLAVPIIFTILVSVFTFTPAFGANNPLDLLAANEIGYLFPLAFSLAFGVAILRTRLWDIDNLINRTLVYGALTAILAALYFTMVLGAQVLGERLTGQTSPPAWLIAVTTLAIAAIFTPLRRRLQRFVDRRFYRAKYDAARTLERFAATLRSDTNLPYLTEHLVSVVEETMQPSHVSLWLRAPTRSPDVER